MSGFGVRQRGLPRIDARYRSRPTCTFAAGTRTEAGRLQEVSAAGAVLHTNARPPLGERGTLRHPEAGEVNARVTRHTREGIGLSFDLDERSVAFALLALATDMTR